MKGSEFSRKRLAETNREVGSMTYTALEIGEEEEVVVVEPLEEPVPADDPVPEPEPEKVPALT